MSERRDIWVICYDITEASLRRQIADFLLDFGVRVQESVYELRVTKTVMMRIWSKTTAQLTMSDSMRLYRISAGARSDCLTFNGAPAPERGEFWIF